MNEGMVLERDAARDLAELERDIEVFACYWERRKERFLDEVWEEFSLRVQPRAICDAGSLPHDIAFMNVAMTEWFLFERAYQDGLTPLEFYVEHGLEGIAGDTADRLRQVARTQLFSRFAICEKDAASARGARGHAKPSALRRLRPPALRGAELAEGRHRGAHRARGRRLADGRARAALRPRSASPRDVGDARRGTRGR